MRADYSENVSNTCTLSEYTHDAACANGWCALRHAKCDDAHDSIMNALQYHERALGIVRLFVAFGSCYRRLRSRFVDQHR